LKAVVKVYSLDTFACGNISWNLRDLVYGVDDSFSGLTISN
jgi:hypothetical protein